MDIDLLDSSTQDPDFFFPRCYGFHARVLYFSSSRRQRAITTTSLTPLAPPFYIYLQQMLCHERPLREPQYTTTTLLYQSWPAAIEAAKVQESLRSSLSCHRGFRTSRCWLWSDIQYIYTYSFKLKYIYKKSLVSSFFVYV